MTKIYIPFEIRKQVVEEFFNHNHWLHIAMQPVIRDFFDKYDIWEEYV